MLTLTVRVHPARERTGLAELREGTRVHARGPAVASAAPALAARRGNPGCEALRPWGHPPFGGYRLLRCLRARPEFGDEYGDHVLLFEPESGPALEAESHGRLALLAYSGPAGRDGRMRRTQGGLRLPERMLLDIVQRLRGVMEMTLRIEPLRAPAWWQFWRRAEDTMPLSATEPAFAAPPADEASVMEALLMDPAVARRAPRRPVREEPRGRDEDRHSDDRRDSSSGGPDPGGERFRGRGGEGAGAGASGNWDDARARPAGVDQAGRILAAGAATAAAAALASQGAAAASRAEQKRAGSGDERAETDTPEASGPAAASGFPGYPDAGGSAPDSGSEGSSTAY
ncbi:MAG: hypothetical protein IT529_13650 [Burkholderiales bacterium]|nr:hypothetical protein [Burkholderiales bacterium]